MYVRVRAVPDARKERIIADAPQVYTISVKEPAANNRANQRIREIVAQLCGVGLKQVRLVTGHRSSSKMFTVDVKER